MPCPPFNVYDSNKGPTSPLEQAWIGPLNKEKSALKNQIDIGFDGCFPNGSPVTT